MSSSTSGFVSTAPFSASTVLPGFPLESGLWTSSGEQPAEEAPVQAVDGRERELDRRPSSCSRASRMITS